LGTYRCTQNTGIININYSYNYRLGTEILNNNNDNDLLFVLIKSIYFKYLTNLINFTLDYHIIIAIIIFQTLINL